MFDNSIGAEISLDTKKGGLSMQMNLVKLNSEDEKEEVAH